MEKVNLYEDIAKRTGGDIYIGVVGPVRTGKSTFIKKFMETLVIPNIDSEYRKDRAIDELPQSSGGKTIMTTEPKFIPEEAVKVSVNSGATFNVRMIDCVGYIVPSSLGYFENDAPRMIETPWFDREVPFNMAAEIGTQKVITEHSTIGILVTTDGSISEIPREEYMEAEERVVDELKKINKPFVVLLNCVDPRSGASRELQKQMTEKYEVPVILTNCLELELDDIKNILTNVLYEFPVKEISIKMAKWIMNLDKSHWLKSALYSAIKNSASNINHISQVESMVNGISECDYIETAGVKSIDLGKGSVMVNINIKGELFYKVLCEQTGIEINSEADLMPTLIEYSNIKKEYDKVKSAIDEVNATGYGIVMPGLDELRLEEPEIVRQGGKYGVKLKASSPSIHMLRADITTEISPIVGSEKQSEELVRYLLKEFEEDPKNIWQSNIFGKSLNELVNEGLHNKLYHMPSEARLKLQETIERIINEGCGGLICIIL